MATCSGKTGGTDDELSRVPVDAQFAALLAGHHAGRDGWSEANLGPAALEASTPFASVFSVTPAELVAHVQAHGWDRRLIKPLTEATPTARPNHADLLAFAGQTADGVWRCLLPLDPERHTEPYATRDFASEAQMVEWLVAELFKLQRRFFPS